MLAIQKFPSWTTDYSPGLCTEEERQVVTEHCKERGLAGVARGRFAVRPLWAEEMRRGHVGTGVGRQAGVKVGAAPCGLAARLPETASRPALSAKRSSDRQVLEPTCWLRRLALP